MNDSTHLKAEPDKPPRARYWTVPILIAVLGGLEVVILAILFFFDTPLTRYAWRASETISGTVLLVGSILVALCVATAIFWAIFNKYEKHRDNGTD